jgi:hypothetical protein
MKVRTNPTEQNDGDTRRVALRFFSITKKKGNENEETKI